MGWLLACVTMVLDATMHSATGSSKADPYLRQAYRDVLVVAFTEREAQTKAA